MNINYLTKSVYYSYIIKLYSFLVQQGQFATVAIEKIKTKESPTRQN
jgi:hypothetical protein